MVPERRLFCLYCREIAVDGVRLLGVSRNISNVARCFLLFLLFTITGIPGTSITYRARDPYCVPKSIEGGGSNMISHPGSEKGVKQKCEEG